LRGGQAIAEVDLYEFILNGQLPMVQFQEGDTILVHPTRPRRPTDRRCRDSRQYRVQGGRDEREGSTRRDPGAATATEVTVQGIRKGVPISHTLSRAAFSSFAVQDGDVITMREDGRADTILVHIEASIRGRRCWQCAAVRAWWTY
jgi:hypothetical protein